MQTHNFTIFQLQLKSLETTLAGSLRREKMAENSVTQLEAEIELLNRLVRLTSLFHSKIGIHFKQV